MKNTNQNNSAGKHTPGPWTVRTVKTSIGHAHQIDPIAACLYVDHRASDECDCKTATALANAELISKAPELLSQNTALLARVRELEEALSGLLLKFSFHMKLEGDLKFIENAQTILAKDQPRDLSAAALRC